MSKQYDEYLENHIANVKKGFDWLCSHFSDIRDKMKDHVYLIEMHDESKRNTLEYMAYDRYFYGKNKSYKVVQDYKLAWLKHIHMNPHHWQHWVLQHDEEPEEILEMPYWYVIEMICDWWSFSWKTDRLNEIFAWYEQHKKGMKLHQKTRKLVEDILDRMKKELEEAEQQ
ncbi:DUF5662 family protein [Pseudobutyrivibrio sp.]